VEYVMGEQMTRFCDVKVKGRKTPCGQPVPDNEPTHITYGTTRFSMDLCDEHKLKLEAAIQPYTDIAHDTAKRMGTVVRKAVATKRGTAFTTKDVRKWLEEQGREVSSTGRLPDHLIKEFQEAHK
jgi:hypothetical protein